jgi:hypothetical protein
VDPEPPLLIIAALADSFDLAHLPWTEAARERISVNSAKFRDLDMLEVIVDGMPFLLSHLTAAETSQKFSDDSFAQRFSELPSSGNSTIGVAPREILASGRHLPEINHRLLLLGKWIGDSLTATAVAWIPSHKLFSFEYYDKAVGEYLAGGQLPSAFQTFFSES